MDSRGAEAARYAFLVQRDGEAAARAWMLDLARTYRRVVLAMRGPAPRLTAYRLRLIASYLDAKRLAVP